MVIFCANDIGNKNLITVTIGDAIVKRLQITHNIVS